MRKAERLLAGSPVEPLVRWLWSEIRSIGRPRARQSMRYDTETIAVLGRIARSDSNCVDIGAHRGSLLRQIVKLAPQGRHFAFEPIPEFAHRLKESFPSVSVHQLALSDQVGESTFCYVVDDPGCSGFRRMGHVRVNADVREMQVSTDTLDRVLPADLSVSFIKVDVEGAQLQVLRGAISTIKRDRPFIVFEHGILAKESYGTTSEMIFDLLVGQCGLNISLMSEWLAGREPMDRGRFCRQVGYHTGSHFCFLAHP